MNTHLNTTTRKIDKDINSPNTRGFWSKVLWYSYCCCCCCGCCCC